MGRRVSGRPVIGGVVRLVVQDLTKRRWAGRRVSEGCEICLVLQTLWYSICNNIIQSAFVPFFWEGTNGQRGGYAMELWPLRCTKLSYI